MNTKPSSTPLTLAEAQHLQTIEGNPLDAEQLALFARFEREGWSPEQCRAYLLALYTAPDESDDLPRAAE